MILHIPREWIKNLENEDKIYKLGDKYFRTDIRIIGPEGPVDEVEFRKELIKLGETEVLRRFDNGEIPFC